MSGEKKQYFLFSTSGHFILWTYLIHHIVKKIDLFSMNLLEYPPFSLSLQVIDNICITQDCDNNFTLLRKRRYTYYNNSLLIPFIISWGPSCPWLYGSWIYNYLCNQCLSPLMLWVRTPFDTTFCDKVCQWPATGRWFSLGIPVSFTNKTDRHDIAEILSH